MITDLGLVVVAAGNSRRFGTEDKLRWDLNGMPLFLHSLKTFLEYVQIENIVLVCGQERFGEFAPLQESFLGRNISMVAGGKLRQVSALNGLQALPGELTYAAVHDAARPFIDGPTLLSCYQSLCKNGSAVLAHPVTDTIKIVNTFNKVLSTPNRETLLAAETPQMFKRQELIKAYEQGISQGKIFTDEAMAMEAAGHEVYMFAHEGNNRKITYRQDLG